MSIKHLDIVTKVIIHINYRDIFNAPVTKEELYNWLNIKLTSPLSVQLENAIQLLKKERLIEERNQYIFVKGRESLLNTIEVKKDLTKQILKKKQRIIQIWAKLPFIRFIGLSGSLAVNNPSYSKDAKKQAEIDVDLFFITQKNTLWLIFFFQRIYLWINLAFKTLPSNHLCINYITEESFLDIYNKNFFTATDLLNLKVIKGEEIYQKLIETNRWYSEYYPTELPKASIEKKKSATAWLAPFNYFMYCIFHLFLCVKERKALKWSDISTTFSFEKTYNYRRISPMNGGHQEHIAKKFKAFFIRNFPKYYNETIINTLFPPKYKADFSTEMAQRHKKKMELEFTKYSKS